MARVVPAAEYELPGGGRVRDHGRVAAVDDGGNVIAYGHIEADVIGIAAPGERVRSSLHFVGVAIERGDAA